MIRCSFAFNGGAAYDSYDRYRMVYISADKTLHQQIADNEETTYAEEHGVHSTMVYKPKSFEYKINFIIIGHNTTLDRINTYIKQFITDSHNGDVLKDITYINTYRRTMIVGKLKEIKMSDFYRRNRVNINLEKIDDNIQIELTLSVTDPTKCNFAYGLQREILPEDEDSTEGV